MVLIIIISALLFAEAMRRYVHNSGMISLKVDDFLPGTFVEHNYQGTDYLWRGFVAFALDSHYILHGIGADSDGLFTDSNYEFDDTLIFGATEDGDTVYFYSNPLYVDRDVQYFGDTAIARIETVTVEVIADEYHVSFDPTITYLYSVGSDTSWSNTVDNDAIDFVATAWRKLPGGMQREDFYVHSIETLYYRYTYNVYVSSDDDTFRIPPDEFPDDTTGMGITFIGQDSAYTEEIWVHELEDDIRYYVPPDTLPISDTARAHLVMDTLSAQVWQYTYEDTISGIIYNVPPRDLPDSLEHIVLRDSNLIVAYFDRETTFVGAKTVNCFGDISNGVYIRQRIESDYMPDSLDSINYIPVNYTIFNVGDGALKDTRIMFFYDADFSTVYPTMLDDMCRFDYDRRAAYIFDNMDFDGLHMGFAFEDLDSFVYSDDSIYFGSHENWYGTGRRFSDLKDLVFYPSFKHYAFDTTYLEDDSIYIDTNAVDCAVYAVINIPDVMPGETLSIDMAYIGGMYDDFIDATYEFRGEDPDTDRIVESEIVNADIPEDIGIKAYPNPFNSSLNIEIPANTDINIYGIDGKKLAHFRKRPFQQNRRWQPKNLPSGIYMIIPDNPEIEPGRVILVK